MWNLRRYREEDGDSDRTVELFAFIGEGSSPLWGDRLLLLLIMHLCQ